MGAHALGAAAYAAKAAGLAAPDRPDALTDETRWQLGTIIRDLQANLDGATHPISPSSQVSYDGDSS